MSGHDWPVGAPLALTVAIMIAAQIGGTLGTVRAVARGWPLWRCGPPMVALLLHDLLAGLLLLGLLAGVPAWLLRQGGAGPDTVLVAVLVGSVAAVVGAGRLLPSRPGTRLVDRFGIAWPGRAGRPAVRVELLQAVERRAVRASSRWIFTQLIRCRRRSTATAETLLPAAWSPARTLIREAAGANRTEAGLVLVQLQAVMDDATPAQERLLTVLQIVHDRLGPGGVHRVLAEAQQAPPRYGRSGAPGWTSAVPAPRDQVTVR